MLSKKSFMKVCILIAIFVNSCFSIAQNLISAEVIVNRSKEQVASIINKDITNVNAVISYKIIYNTVDVNGAPTVASGALYVPQGLCDELPIVSYHHGTQFDKNNVPSNNEYYYQGLIFSGSGYITTMPDYLGLGENSGIHPYIHWESEATASLDLIRAAREFLANSLSISDNNQLFLAGYSQGGHATMATHKYITVNDLKDEFNVVASAPLSAPLDISKTQMDFIFDDSPVYYTSQYIPYVAASYQFVYGNLYNNLNEYYDSPYDVTIGNYLSDGTFSNNQWNSAIPNNLYTFMQDSVVDNIKNKSNHPFRKAARENDVHNWVSNEPIRLLYCGGDTSVTPLNSIVAANEMNALGSSDVVGIDLNSSGTHETCLIPTINYALNWFNSLTVFCESLNQKKKDSELRQKYIYPNPVGNILNINFCNYCFVKIYDVNGRVILKSNSNSINVSNLESGIYFVETLDLDSNKHYINKIHKQ